MNEHLIVGWAEDADVSGAVDAFDAPALGPWLNQRAPEWDILAAWKLDRLGRNAIQLSKLFGWCNEHEKTLVSCSESIDLGTWAGRMLASVIAGLAEGELETMRERSRGSRRKLRESARWAGGKPPFGYRAVKLEGGGYTLEVDAVAEPLVRKIVDSVIDGTPLNRLATELNELGYLTPGDYYKTVKSDAPRLFRTDETKRWSATPLRNMLRNKALRGHVHHNGETVRDDEGRPIELVDEPLVTDDEWALIQSTLDRRRESSKGLRRAELSPLAGIVVCLKCEGSLWMSRSKARGRQYGYYRCENRDSTMVPAEMLETLVEELFLDEVGDIEVRQRVWVPGDSRESDLREAVAALDELTAIAGKLSSVTAKARLTRQIGALDSKIADLESAPARQSRWEYQATGGTYRSAWESLDTDGRRQLLLRSGITVAISIDTGEERRSPSNPGVPIFEIRVPTEVKERLESAQL